MVILHMAAVSLPQRHILLQRRLAVRGGKIGDGGWHARLQIREDLLDLPWKGQLRVEPGSIQIAAD